MPLDTRGHGGFVIPEYLMTGLTALGSGQSSAFQLAPNTAHEFTSVPASTAAVLPVVERFPCQVSVWNADTGTLALYPQPGGTINGGSVNSSVSIAAGTGATYWAAGPLTWYARNAAAASTFGANFGYDATNACPQFTAIADPATPSLGDEWLSTVSGGLVAQSVLGTSRPGTEIFQCGSCTNINNFSAFTSLLNTPTGSRGSLTIKANTLKAGQILEVFPWLIYSNTGTPTFALQILLGATVVLQTPGIPTTAGLTNFGILPNVPPRLIFTAVGSGGSVTGVGSMALMTTGTSSSLYPMLSSATGANQPVPVATGVDLVFDIQAKFGAASTSNIAQLLGLSIVSRN